MHKMAAGLSACAVPLQTDESGFSLIRLSLWSGALQEVEGGGHCFSQPYSWLFLFIKSTTKVIRWIVNCLAQGCSLKDHCFAGHVTDSTRLMVAHWRKDQTQLWTDSTKKDRLKMKSHVASYHTYTHKRNTCVLIYRN